MTAVIEKISIADLESSPNFHVLAREYAEECAIAELPPPDEKLAAYRLIEASGIFHGYGAFVSGEIVGFISLLIPVIPHYGVAVAMTESFFVAKTHRGTGAGLKLLHTVENHAREAGAPALMVSAPYGGKLSRVLPGLGYRQTNQVFLRRLNA